jgi:hypothetical protein
MPLSDAEWTALARDARRALARSSPQWTDTDPSDPGVTLGALFAFLAEELAYRSGSLAAPTRRLAHEVALRAVALANGLSATTDPASDGGGLRRVNYFDGQLLGAGDFQTEQGYLLGRLARRNRLLHGAGIVDGLAVTIDADSDPHAQRIVVAPGLAFDAFGREIGVDAPWSAPLPASADALLVRLAYRERACGAVPALPGSTAGDATAAAGTTQPTRIVESFEVTLAPAPAADAVTLARVRRTRGRWRVDPKFALTRVRR